MSDSEEKRLNKSTIDNNLNNSRDLKRSQSAKKIKAVPPRDKSPRTENKVNKSFSKK